MRVQLLSEIHLIVPDQAGNALLLADKALGMMQSVLYMEPGQCLNSLTQIVDHCLAFHAYLPPSLLRSAAPALSLSSLPFPPVSAAAAGFVFFYDITMRGRSMATPEYCRNSYPISVYISKYDKYFN